MKIEGPEDRGPVRFTPDEARAFMASWYRVVEDDGSTVAYAPDVVTARLIAAAQDLYEILKHVAKRWDEYDAPRLGDEIRAAVAKAEGRTA